MGEEGAELDDYQVGEFFWGCELSKESPSVTFSIKEEDEDSDYMHHTLFVKHAVLGAQAVKDEVNIVSVETQNFDKETIKQPFISLTRGESSMCFMDISFTDKSPVTFTLSEGTGPIYISAVQLVEFPEEDEQVMDEEVLTEEEEESPVKPKLKTNKRKGGAAVGASKAKRSKMEEDDEEEESDDDEDEDDEDDDDEEMDDEEEEPSPEKKKGAKKKNVKAGKGASKKEVEKPKKKAAKKSKK